MSSRLIEFRGHPIIEDRWDLVHRHSIGRAGEAFLSGLANGQLVAAHCPLCERTLLPPRGFCERCFVATELAPFVERNGELLSFTIVRRAFTDSPDVPYAIGYARLGGADTAIGALIDEVNLEPVVGKPALGVGMTVELVIREEGIGVDRLRLRPGERHE